MEEEQRPTNDEMELLRRNIRLFISGVNLQEKWEESEFERKVRKTM